MPGFDDAFEAHRAHLQDVDRRARSTQHDHQTRVKLIRQQSYQQLIDVGLQAISVLRRNDIPPVTLVADRGRFHRAVPVASGWPLVFHAFTQDGHTYRTFRWFVLEDGRNSPVGDPNRLEDFESRYVPIHAKDQRLDQLAQFDRRFSRLIDEIEACVHNKDGYYRFGWTGTAYSTTNNTNLVFDEQANMLMYTGLEAPSGALGTKCVPFEDRLAQWVAENMRNPASVYWGT